MFKRGDYVLSKNDILYKVHGAPRSPSGKMIVATVLSNCGREDEGPRRSVFAKNFTAEKD